MDTRRSYNSPLRDEQAQATRSAILEALYTLMTRQDGPEEITFEAIAHAAGIQRRTVHRHFPAREDLLAAFWPWLNARIGSSTAPETLADIVQGPSQAFPLFDEHEPAMRAAIHSRTGREMRLGTVPARRARFARALAPATATLPATQAEMVEALAHLLYSAPAWEVMKDYGGLTGAQAGRTATWALEVILSAVTSGRSPADVPSPDEGERDAR
jgi:AcrR family transcriptional regulator